MSTIASLNVAMNVGSATFKSGFHECEGAVESFEGVLGGLEAVLGVVGLALGARELYEWVAGAGEAVEQTGKLSQILGASTEGLSALHLQAKENSVSTEQLDSALEKLSKNLGEAAVKGGPPKEALDQLGLSAEELTKIPVDDALRQIAEKFASIENPAERSHLAVELFGKSGQSLIPILEEGAAGMDEAREKAEKYGTSLSAVDVAKVEASHRALVDAGEAVQGLGQTIAIDLAPFVEATAEKFTELATAGGGLRSTVEPTIDFLVYGFAGVSDVIYMATTGADELGHTIVEVVGMGFLVADKGAELLLETVDLLAHTDFSGLEHQLRDLNGIVNNQMEESFKKIQEDAAKPLPHTAIIAAYDDIKKKAEEAAEAAAKVNAPHPGAGDDEAPKEKEHTDAVTKSIEELQKQEETFGMNARQMLVYKLTAEGATEAQIKMALGIEHTIEDLEKQKKAQDDAAAAVKKHEEDLQSFAKSTIENTETPLEKYNEQLAKLDDAHNHGYLTMEQYTAGVDKARQALDKANESAEKFAHQVEGKQLGQFEIAFAHSIDAGVSAQANAVGRAASGSGWEPASSADATAPKTAQDDPVLLILNKIYDAVRNSPGAVWGQ